MLGLGLGLGLGLDLSTRGRACVVEQAGQRGARVEEALGLRGDRVVHRARQVHPADRLGNVGAERGGVEGGARLDGELG